mmetsp:Transcript_95132/g.301863  ORF Transcript_95132/g.301863 Transcript_95132/m.301863 type:complete len:265 (-) Transcript_95132:430-1224(-)
MLLAIPSTQRTHTRSFGDAAALRPSWAIFSWRAWYSRTAVFSVSRSMTNCRLRIVAVQSFVELSAERGPNRIGNLLSAYSSLRTSAVASSLANTSGSMQNRASTSVGRSSSRRAWRPRRCASSAATADAASSRRRSPGPSRYALMVLRSASGVRAEAAASAPWTWRRSSGPPGPCSSLSSSPWTRAKTGKLPSRLERERRAGSTAGAPTADETATAFAGTGFSSACPSCSAAMLGSVPATPSKSSGTTEAGPQGDTVDVSTPTA